MHFNNLVQTLRHHADHTPDQTSFSFLEDGETIGKQYTYGELDEQAKVIGATLQQISNTGERALMLYPSGLDFVAAFLGCQYAGVVAVPALPPNLNRIQTTLDRLYSIIKDARPEVILTTAELLPSLKAATQGIPAFAKVIWQATTHLQKSRAFMWQEPTVQTTDLSFLQYTSGSTSAPKGVMVSHRNIMYNLAMLKATVSPFEGSNAVSWLPLFHDMGLIGMVLHGLYGGGETRLMSPLSFLKSPVRWLKAISNHKNVFSGAPNFAYDLCLRKITEEQKEGLDLSNWKVAFNGAETVRSATLDQFFEAFKGCGLEKEAILPCYGLAETTLIVSGRTPGKDFKVQKVDQEAYEKGNIMAPSHKEAPEMEIVSCGTTKLDQEIAIVDPGTLKDLGERKVGEIWVKGENCGEGYWENEAKTEATFRAMTQEGKGPYLRTGDLGFIDQGELFITGRIKEIIVVRGRCLYPQDLELIVESLHADFPEIRPNGSAAFALMGTEKEKIGLIVEINRRKNKAYDPEKLIAEIQKQALEKFEVGLGEIAFIKSSIPKTSSGKKMRNRCREMMEKGASQTMMVEHHWRIGGTLAEISQPEESSEEKAKTKETQPKTTQTVSNLLSQSELESLLVHWIAEEEKIEVANISPLQPITDFGLDSLAAVTLVDFLEQKLDTTLDANLVFGFKTIAELANHLEKRQA